MPRAAALLVILAAMVAPQGCVGAGGMWGKLTAPGPWTNWSKKPAWVPDIRLPTKQAAGAGGGSQAQALAQQADGLMKKRKLRDVQEAVKLYMQALEEAGGEDLGLKLKAADAMNCAMRIRTNANTILIEGGLDTPANKKIWASEGPDALNLAKTVYKARPGDVDALAVYADSYMFSTSSKGIVKQALTGAGKEFQRVARELIKFPKHDSGVGYALLGAFYAVAPWPLGDLSKALQNMETAVKVFPSRRNLYYCGVVHYKRKEWAKAIEAFEKALSAKCGSVTEEDFGQFMLDKSREGIVAASKHLMEGK